MNYVELKLFCSEDQLKRELLVYELGELGYDSFQEFKDHISAFITEDHYDDSHKQLITKHLSTIVRENYYAILL